MRTGWILALGVSLLATPAMGRTSAGFSVGDLHATHEVLQKRAQTTSMLESPGSPLGQLSKTTRAWIREETRRQGAAPRPLAAVVQDVNARLEEDARDLSRRHDIDPADITRVVTLLIMVDAEDDSTKALKRARKGGDPATVAAAEQHLATATVNRKGAMDMQSQVSLALAWM